MAASDRVALGPLVGSIDQGTSSSRFLVSTTRGSRGEGAGTGRGRCAGCPPTHTPPQPPCALGEGQRRPAPAAAPAGGRGGGGVLRAPRPAACRRMELPPGGRGEIPCVKTPPAGLQPAVGASRGGCCSSGLGVSVSRRSGGWARPPCGRWAWLSSGGGRVCLRMGRLMTAP